MSLPPNQLQYRTVYPLICCLFSFDLYLDHLSRPLITPSPALRFSGSPQSTMGQQNAAPQACCQSSIAQLRTQHLQELRTIIEDNMRQQLRVETERDAAREGREEDARRVERLEQSLEHCRTATALISQEAAEKEEDVQQLKTINKTLIADNGKLQEESRRKNQECERLKAELAIANASLNPLRHMNQVVASNGMTASLGRVCTMPQAVTTICTDAIYDPIVQAAHQFPIEVLVNIARFLAGDNSYGTLAALCVSSKRTHHEVQPILFETVVWDGRLTEQFVAGKETGEWPKFWEHIKYGFCSGVGAVC
jgi:hypothetical protein